MNKEERFEIELNQEDVQNIINCYEKDIKLIKQLQQENKELKRNCNIGNENLSFYRNENKELHNKIDKAIEYMKPRFMNCIDNDKRYFADVYIQEIYEILKDSDVDE